MNLEQFKIAGKIKVSYLRHRGDTIAVAKELGYDQRMVNKYVHKIKKKDERDVNSLIASNLMTHLFMGYESRVGYVMELLASLDGRHQVHISACCRHSTGTTDTGIICLKCSLSCQTIILDQLGVYELKQKLLEQLREEDKVLVEFAEKMGYTEKKEQAPVVQFQDKRQMVFMGENSLASELTKLTPIERETLRLKFEKSIIEESKSDNSSV